MQVIPYTSVSKSSITLSVPPLATTRLQTRPFVYTLLFSTRHPHLSQESRSLHACLPACPSNKHIHVFCVIARDTTWSPFISSPASRRGQEVRTQKPGFRTAELQDSGLQDSMTFRTLLSCETMHMGADMISSQSRAARESGL